MKIHLSETDLKNLRFKFKIIDGELNIKGYNNKELKDKTCPHCLLKSFKKSDTITITALSFNRSCSCSFDLLPSINLKVNANKNPKITFA